MPRQSVTGAVRVTGPLAPYRAGFARELARLGYTPVSAAEQLRLMAHASRWLAAQGLDAAGLTPERAEDFCGARRAEGYTGHRTPRALARLQEFLRSQGVAVPPAAVPLTAREQLLERYRDYLRCSRGLAGRVVSRCVETARSFLARLEDGGTRPGAGDVTAFCARELAGRSGSVARNTASELRSFLRFLHLEGLVSAPLAHLVPPVAARKGAGLPKGVPAATVGRLVQSCDRRSAVGRRDYAILLLLARLGLRAGEVAALSLDDIHWRDGELTVHGKGGRRDRLPLPSDVGAAIAAYLRRDRPGTTSRRVFLRAIAPAAALSPTGVTWVVYAACDRAGVPRFGAHRLRHALACELLRHGASLPEVGQVLRHAAVGTTAIYAKADFAALAPLAPPWPGGAA
jgi:integrase/recombinase XerD